MWSSPLENLAKPAVLTFCVTSLTQGELGKKDKFETAEKSQGLLEYLGVLSVQQQLRCQVFAVIFDSVFTIYLVFCHFHFEVGLNLILFYFQSQFESQPFIYYTEPCEVTFLNGIEEVILDLINQSSWWWSLTWLFCCVFSQFFFHTYKGADTIKIWK